MPLTASAIDAAQTIARTGLDAPERIEHIDDVAWRRLVDVLVAQRCTGQAVRAWREGGFELDPQRLATLLDRHEEQLALDLRIERFIIDCCEALTNAGIEFRVVKGPAIAHRFYTDPSERSFGDGDVLVRRRDFAATLETLSGVGLVRRMASPRRSFDRFIKAACLVDVDGMQLDVHQTLAPGPYGVLIDTDALFERPATVTLGNSTLPCLADDATLLHACAHAVLGDPVPRLMSCRDVAQILASIDHARAIETFERFRAGAIAQRAVGVVQLTLGFTPNGAFVDWALAHALSRSDRWRLDSYECDGSRYAAQTAATFWVLPTIRDRFAFASALAFPRHGYVTDRQGTYSGRVARGASLLLRWRPR